MKPILVVSDSPDCRSGLARIGRDVALRLKRAGAQVGYCGYWGKGWGWNDPEGTLGIPFLAAGPDPTKNLLPVCLAADEFFQGEPGVVLFLYDPTWLVSLAGSVVDKMGRMAEELPWDVVATTAWARRRKGRGIEFWGAFPVDAHCPDGKLPSITGAALQEWDRVAGWTTYGSQVLSRSLTGRDGNVRVLPLGMDPLWQQGDAERGRQILGVIGRPILGAVGTNQPRKDWGLTFAAFAEMPEEWVLWAHVDRRHDYWNLNQLRDVYGLGERVRFTRSLTDPQLADCYAVCKVTFGLGRGEGFGYPLLESQLTGTPCVTFDYASGPELTPNTVQSMVLRPEGPYSFLRPVTHPSELAHRLQGPMVMGKPELWLWENAWRHWEAWFREGGVL